MLECESDDGLVFWNFFDDAIAVDKDFPVFRVELPMQFPTQKLSEINQKQKVTLGMIGSEGSPWAGVSTPSWSEGNQIEVGLYGRRLC